MNDSLVEHLSLNKYMFYEDDIDHIETISYSNFNFQKIYLNDIREFWLGIKENINA